jgi:hypothetical protein
LNVLFYIFLRKGGLVGLDTKMFVDFLFFSTEKSSYFFNSCMLYEGFVVLKFSAMLRIISHKVLSQIYARVKSLFNAIKFFGYYDLRIKEYWLNIKKDDADTLTPLQQNQKILNQLKKHLPIILKLMVLLNKLLQVKLQNINLY